MTADVEGQLLQLATWVAVALATSTLAAVVVERAFFAYDQKWHRRLQRHYLPVVERALEGDAEAMRTLVASPARHRVAIATFLITALIDDRDPRRIAKTRSLVQRMSLVPYVEQLVRSRRWWRRALGLRALGLMQEKGHTAAIVAALDDPDPDVRAAALDALADLRDPASLAAIVVRLNDMSLERGRCLAALAAFGSEAEPRVLELAEIDPLHRADYARALGTCGSQLSRTALCEWAIDHRADVRAAAFRALARLGLDDRGAGLAIEALDSADASVRAMAAHALHGWIGSGDAASRLADRLDDTWTVAVQAARSLEAMGPAGAVALRDPATLRSRCVSRPPDPLAGQPVVTMPAAAAALVGMAAIGTAYFALWAVTQLAMGARSTLSLVRHQRRRTRRARALVDRVATPTISVIVPSYNEELTIVDTVRALLALDYEAREIVIVNDGSSDATLSILQRTFQLVPGPLVFAQPLQTRPLRGIYRSMTEPDLVVVDKDNGGCKADASNAGINAASGRLVLIIDADTVLDPEALNDAVLSFLEDPFTVAVGAYVAIANGCRIEGGRVVGVSLPRGWLARFQVVEYMRAFLLFRLACAYRNGLLILSGAFGLFRRDAVIAVGGFDPTAIGEDMDLTVRLHRHYRAAGERFRVAFTPKPLCRTQAPEDWPSLQSQRYRWRRGLIQTIWRHRDAIGNPRYGAVGLMTFPYTVIFEGIAPVLELTSYVAATIAVLLGLLDWERYLLMVTVWVMFGCAVSLMAVLLNDIATREYMRGSDLILLVCVALLENCGYRQINSWWSCVGTVQAMTGKTGWGAMKRRTFQAEDARL